MTVEWSKILKDVCIVYGLTFSGGYIMLSDAGVDIRDKPDPYNLASYAMGILCFTIVGALPGSHATNTSGWWRSPSESAARQIS